MSTLTDLYPPMRGIGNLPWYTLLGGAGVVYERANQATTTPITVTAAGTAHTPGAWAELLDATPGESTLMSLRVAGVAVSGAESSTLLDLATGAAGSEVVLASGIAIGGAAGLQVNLPVRIPAGVRIAARIQALRTTPQTATISLSLYMAGATHLVPTSVDVLGSDAATSRGTAMSGSSGSFVEVVASTSRAYRAVVVVPSVVGSNVVGTDERRYDLAIGGLGAESVVGGVTLRAASNEAIGNGSLGSLPIAHYIPAGSRLSVRHNIPSSPGQLGVCLLGVP